MAEASPPEAGASSRKPWMRPRFEVRDIEDTEVGPSNGPDAFTSVS